MAPNKQQHHFFVDLIGLIGRAQALSADKRHCAKSPYHLVNIYLEIRKSPVLKR